MKVALWIIAGLLVLGTAEYATRSQMPSAATVRLDTQPGSRKLAVLYAGLMGNVNTQFGKVAEWYQASGYDVVFVEATGLYSAELVSVAAARTVTTAVDTGQYDEIVFDGLSLGGRAAVDTLQLLREMGVRLPKSTLLLEGAPMTYRSVRGPTKYGAWVAARLPFGWLSDKVPLLDWIFIPPKEENIEASADRVALEQSVAAARRTPLSRYSSELNSFAGRSAYANDSLSGLVDKAVFVWFDKDHDTVDQEVALQEWQRAFGPQAVSVIRVDSTHVGIGEAPQANIDAHVRALSI